MSEMSHRRARAWVTFLCCACFALGVEGCISTPTKSPLMQQADNLIDMTSVQLRGQLYDFTSRYSTVVEGAADRIMEASDDPAVREWALTWKLESIPQVHRAAFKPDPLLGLIDTAVLCGQMVDFLTDGAGSHLFGDHQYIAIEAAEWLKRDVWRLAESLTLSGDPVRARREIAEFVAEHPIGDLYFLRDSVEPLLATLTQGTQGRSGGAGAVIGGINEAVDDLSKRITIYAAHLPNEARWQAELAAMQMSRHPPLEDSLRALESFAESHKLFAESVASALDLISAEREVAFDELEALSQRRIADVDEQRIESIAVLQSEREVLVQVIEAQTEMALQRISAERDETLDRLDKTIETTVESSFDHAGDLADRLFIRGLILVAILALALLVVGVLIARMLRRPVLAPPT